MRRRQALLVLGGVATLVGLGARLPEESGVTAILRKRLNYLELDPAGVREFARDYVARQLMSPGKLRVLAAVGPLYTRLSRGWSELLTADIEHGEERIVTTYLLSSDFFAGVDHADRTVRYLGFFDPLGGGGNPFANPRCQVVQARRFPPTASCEVPC
jgi:hypothetical protein